jgi:hypothetical protein
MPIGFDLSGEIASENAIAVSEAVTWNLIKREGLPQLLAGPLGGGMSGDIEVDDPPAVVREHHEHIENLEAECGNREKIDRHQRIDCVVEEGTPSLRGGLANTDHVLGDARLTDVDAEFQQFPVKTRRTPERILAAHGADELANVLGNIGSTELAAPDFPLPEESKAFPVPGNDGLRLDDDQCGTPAVPNAT